MRGLPMVVGNEVVNFSKESFAKQGWLDNSFVPWRKRKLNLKKNRSRAILVQSARLKRSIRVLRATGNSVVVGSDAPYARPHNEGFNGVVSVKAYKRNKYSSSRVGSGKMNKSGTERMKTVKGISGSINVKAHSKRMRLPRRKYLGTSQYMMIRIKRTASVYLMKNIQ